MKTLIVEDDFTSRLILQEILLEYGTCHIAINGKEAVEAARMALDAGEPYDLICMDIMMPEMDGQEALQLIRADEDDMNDSVADGTKIVMVTALDDIKQVFKAYSSLCDGYLTKPIDQSKLLDTLKRLALIG